MNTKPFPQTSGIYKITCTANHKIYIGCAANLFTRYKSHTGLLRHNKHFNPHLQHAWNEYGEQSFTFDILELTWPINLQAREQYWIDKLKPFENKGFNIMRVSMYGDGIKNSISGQTLLPKPIKTRLGSYTKNLKKKRPSASDFYKNYTPEELEQMSQPQIARWLREKQVYQRIYQSTL